MREIKFRLWDELAKEVMPVQNIYFDEEDGSFMGVESVTDDVVYFEEEFKKRCSLMQYTGLKDANGVEIFEGDIVKSKNGTGGLIYKHIVEWNNFYKRFEPMGTDESCFNRESCEVIGNIYENPELLEEN